MENRPPCGCGCGNAAPEGKSYLSGHWSRSAAAKAVHRARRMTLPPLNPTGLCLCGCGRPAPIAKTDKPTRGYRRGDFRRYITGHQVPTGPANHQWKGGRTVRRGYVLISKPDHPNADRDGYVLEHRFVAGEARGRVLETSESVHHINGDTLDNRPENLVVVTRRQHGLIHRNVLPDWRQTLDPDEVRERQRASGRKGAEARWGPTRRSHPEATPPKP